MEADITSASKESMQVQNAVVQMNRCKRSRIIRDRDSYFIGNRFCISDGIGNGKIKRFSESED
jgi:hypothetical protein